MQTDSQGNYRRRARRVTSDDPSARYRRNGEPTASIRRRKKQLQPPIRHRHRRELPRAVVASSPDTRQQHRAVDHRHAAQDQDADGTSRDLDAQSDGYTYQWQRCDTQRPSCRRITGATGQAYDGSGADVGHTTLRSSETAPTPAGPRVPPVNRHGRRAQSPPCNMPPRRSPGPLSKGQALTERHGPGRTNPASIATSGSGATPTAQLLDHLGCDRPTYERPPTTSAVG